MFQTMVVIKVKVPPARREVPKKGNRLQQFAGDEYGAGGQHPGKEFSRHQHFAAYRRKEIKVKAAVKDFTAKQVHEDSKASEKDSKTQKKELKNAREHDRILAQVI